MNGPNKKLYQESVDYINSYQRPSNGSDLFDYYTSYNPDLDLRKFLQEKGIAFGDIGASLQESLRNSFVQEKTTRKELYDQWYNSEEQKVARERAAGLNPDLVGISDASSSSTQDSERNMAAGNDIYDSIQLGADLTNQIINSAMSIMGAIQSFQGNSLSNDLKSLNIESALYDLSQNMADTYGFEYFNPQGSSRTVYFDFLGSKRSEKYRDTLSYLARRYANTPKVVSQKFDDQFKAAQYKTRYNALAPYMQSEQNAQFLYDIYVASQQADRYVAFNKRNYAKEFDSGLQASSENFKNSYFNAYYATADPELAAQAFNGSNQYAVDFNLNNAIQQAWVKTFCDQLDKQIKQARKNGNDVLAAALAALAMKTRASLNQPFPSLAKVAGDFVGGAIK